MIKPMHFAQTSIHVTNYFTFQLPVSAFGFRDDMVMEISVEHWRSVDQTMTWLMCGHAKPRRTLSTWYMLCRCRFPSGLRRKRYSRRSTTVRSLSIRCAIILMR